MGSPVLVDLIMLFSSLVDFAHAKRISQQNMLQKEPPSARVLIELDAIMRVFSAMLDHNNFGLGPIDLSLISMEALSLINETQCPYNQNTITGQYETGMQCNHSAARNDDPAVTGSILKDMAANSSPDKKKGTRNGRQQLLRGA
jgi:hypothetical protein